VGLSSLSEGKLAIISRKSK